MAGVTVATPADIDASAQAWPMIAPSRSKVLGIERGT